MVLVDTSVWVDHLRGGDRRLVSLLKAGGVFIHPFVVGELACVNLRNRATALSLLRQLPEARQATHPEALLFIENKKLMGRGIGYARRAQVDRNS
ncbi:MAG: VapC toxin family PIN domain ribonuclease [Sedimenticolaceae bacterium]